MKTVKLLVCLFSIGFGAAAYASTALLPAQGRATAALVLLDTKYEADPSVDYDAKGTMLFAGYKAPLNPRFALGGGIGVVLDGDTSGDFKFKKGSGFRLAIDGDVDVAHFDKNIVIASAELYRDSFSYKKDDNKLELTQTELLLSALIRHDFTKGSVYGGVQAFLMDKGTAKFSSPVGSRDADNTRADRINLRLGVALAADQAVDLRLDLLLFGEQQILVGADFKI